MKRPRSPAQRALAIAAILFGIALPAVMAGFRAVAVIAALVAIAIVLTLIDHLLLRTGDHR